MTGPTDMTHRPEVLIDEYVDGCVEATAWVEVTSEVPDPETAVKVIEGLYPIEDREEEEIYHCDGTKTWQKPDPEFKPEFDDGLDPVPWVEAQEGEDNAKWFWVVQVVCPA
jgi:hypothetical protein